MKVVYCTSPAFFDADLSFVNELRKLVELTVLIDLPSFALNSTALNIQQQPKKAGIYRVSEVQGFETFTQFLGENSFVINRPVAKRLSFETFKINKEIKRFLKKLNPELIHFNNPTTQFGRSLLKFPAKKILTIHDPIPHIGEHSGNLVIRDWNMKYVKSYILLNEFQREDFISNYKLGSNQVHTSFLSVFNFYSDFKVQPIPNEEFNLLFFGRITPYKGIDILIDAFKQLKIVYPKLHLTIAGKGEIPVSARGIEGVKYINRHVSVEELSVLINNCDLVVCPYVEGTQSGVIMTSFAFAKPVLATKVGGFHEMIDDEVTGFLVEPKNVEALKSKLVEIIDQPKILDKISKNITNGYLQNGARSWRSAAERTLDIYQKIQKQNG